jgi:hypothetical protein
VVYFGGFFAKLGYFAGFFFILFAGRISESAMGGARVGVGTYSNMMSCTALSGIFSKTGISTGFSL